MKQRMEPVCAVIASLSFAALAIAAPFTPLAMTITGWAAITVATAALIRISVSRPLEIAGTPPPERPSPGDTSDDCRIDPLTGLPGMAEARNALVAQVEAGQPVAVALIDVDGATRYREAHGDRVTDEGLLSVADAIAATVRPNDTVTRVGADRFVVVFADATASAATAAMERIREAIVLAATAQAIDPMTASVGIASTELHTDVEAMLEAADIAVTVAKRQGGNRVQVVFDSLGPAYGVDPLGPAYGDPR